MRSTRDRLVGVFFIAARELLRRPGHTMLSVLVAGSVVSLVVIFQGLRLGIYQDLVGFPSGLPADLVVMQEGVRNLSLARSVLPQGLRARVEEKDGVKAVHPLASVPVILEARGRRTPIQVIVYDTGGGPREIVRGGRPGKVDGAGLVMDERLAAFLDYAPGDVITVLDYEFTITGTTRETASPFAPYVYITYDGLLDLYFSRGNAVSPNAMIFLSALLVEMAQDVDASALGDIASEYAVWTPPQLGAFDRHMGERLLGPALDVLVLVGFIIAALAMGLMMYAKALDRQREYGIQKALGVSPAWLVGQLAVEAVLLTLLAMPVALLVGMGVGSIVHELSPLYRLEILDAGVISSSWAVSTVACLAGSVMPMQRVASVDAAIVFQEGHA